MFSKKNLGVVAALMLSVVTIGAVSSYAYFSDRAELINDFTTGSLDTGITETEWSNTEDGKNMYPGYTVGKNPTIQNITGMIDNDAYVEAYVHVKDGSGNPITDTARLDLIYFMLRYDASNTLKEGTKYNRYSMQLCPNVNPAFETVSRDDSKGTWTYYLKDTLKSAATPEAGESVTLFNKIAVPTEWSQTELDLVGDFSLTIEFKSIQAATFDNVYDAMNVLNSGTFDIHTDYEENDTNRPSSDER